MAEIVYDPSDHEHGLRRLKAAREIADAERGWSAARSLGERSQRPNLSPQERLASLAVQQAFYELTELEEVSADALPAVIGLFATDKDLFNATLGRLEMSGEWDETHSFERELLGQLYDAGYKNMHLMQRDDPAAKVSITIPAGFTEELGYVALQRKRRLIAARHIDGASAVRPLLEVDKISTFALDIAALHRIDNSAAAEVRLIVAMTMYKALDFGALSRAYGELSGGNMLTAGKFLLGADRGGAVNAVLHHGDFEGYFNLDAAHRAAVERAKEFDAALKRNDISFADVQHRLELSDPIKLYHLRGVDFIEEAIRARHKMLTPSITTYYTH